MLRQRAREAIVTLKFAWEEKYREALLELSAEDLHQRIEAATEAIEQRAEQLSLTGQNSGEEQRAIDDAKRLLSVLARTECQEGGSTKPVSAQTELAS
jgi:hypothetical protein